MCHQENTDNTNIRLLRKILANVKSSAAFQSLSNSNTISTCLCVCTFCLLLTCVLHRVVVICIIACHSGCQPRKYRGFIQYPSFIVIVTQHPNQANSCHAFDIILMYIVTATPTPSMSTSHITRPIKLSSTCTRFLRRSTFLQAHFQMRQNGLRQKSRPLPFSSFLKSGKSESEPQCFQWNCRVEF